MANKSISFTLSNGLGTIDKNEDSILYMSQDTISGNYILALDEGKDRESIYIVNEDLATTIAAGTRLFEVNLSDPAQPVMLNADRISDIVNISGDKTVLATGTASNWIGFDLIDIFRLTPPTHFITIGVIPGDFAKDDSGDVYEISSVGTNTLVMTTPRGLGATNYEIFRGGNEPTKVYFEGLSFAKDYKEVSESISEVKALINAL